MPVSTFLCEYYLGYRGCTRARVVPLHEAQAELVSGGFDVAVNVHSFGEAPRAAVRNGAADREGPNAPTVPCPPPSSQTQTSPHG